MRILYISSYLPRLSETFVYREIFALREWDIDVLTASVHEPDHDLGEMRLTRLADTAIPVYGAGRWPLMRDALLTLFLQPCRSIRTLERAIGDYVKADDVRGMQRLKIIWHGFAALALCRRLREKGVDHIHAHMAHVPASLAMYTAVCMGISFSFTGHAADLFRDRALLRQKLGRAAFVACISHWHRHFYQSLVSRSDKEYPVIRCGVELDELTTSPTKGNHVLRILTIGRLVPKKGFDVLLRALSAMKASSFTCRIIGEGPEYEYLVQLRAEGHMEDMVEFSGALPNVAARKALYNADIFVLPCQVAVSGDRDGIPVALMEAMAAGVCVVAGDLPTIRELIDNDCTGFLVSPGDSNALRLLLERLAADPDLRNRVAQKGREWVREEFSLDTNVARLREAFLSIPDNSGIKLQKGK